MAVGCGNQDAYAVPEISDHLEPSETPKQFLLDYATAVAIKEMGRNHSNDLMTMILERCTSTHVTAPAMQSLVEWVSLPLLKRLMAVAALPVSFRAQLLLMALHNKSYSLDIFRQLTDGYRSYTGHNFLNIVLERTIHASWTARMRRQRSLG